MLPPNLIREFWDTVKRELLQRHELADAKATSAIASYRAALDRHQAGDMVYHREPDDVAETIAAGAESGFPDPVVREK
jgi:hypothetical protein